MTSHSTSNLTDQMHQAVSTFVENEQHIAVAVSGGGDSMALLLALHFYAKASLTNLKIVALTVNHKLRAAAADEAKQVALWCKDLGIEHHILNWQHDEVPQTAVQEKARNARYQLMGDYCLAHNIEQLFVAHNLEDNAETMYMRLKRGAGLKGLSSIADISERMLGEGKSVQIIRPLLNMKRQDLRDYLRQIDQAWIDDVSNENEKFERVQVRHQLNSTKPFGHENLNKSAKRLAVADDAIEFYVDGFWQENVNLLKLGIACLSLDAWSLLPQEIKQRLLARLVWTIGGKDNPPRWQKIETLFTQIENQSGNLVLGNCLIVKKRNKLWFGFEGRDEVQTQMTVPAQHQAMWQNRMLISNHSQNEIDVRNFENSQEVADDFLSKNPELKDCPKLILKKLPLICPASANIEISLKIRR